MSDRISEIVSLVIDVPVENINEDTSPDNTPAWDSMAHLNLIMALESEFQVSLKPEDAMEMLSMKLIKIILEEYGIT